MSRLLPRASVTPGARPAAVTEPPPAPREFRGAWIATVKNIDWPSKPGLSAAQQQAELLALLDRAKALKLNAVILQIRPACDALYASPLEPWSEFLSGTMGQATQPAYDPLAFAVKEAHARGLELHAWFNPFRARLLDADGTAPPAAATHVSRAHPEWVKTYGTYQWLDPGEAGVQAHTLRVIEDVVKRYDIDAVHLDDYFYPYPIPGPGGQDKPFPDDTSWRAYQASGGKLARDDWRRDNVNRFVERLYSVVHAAKPQVKVGISPFGIWRPGNPPAIVGLDPFDKLFADARLWLQRGWLDYIAPQLYWPIEKPAQSFPVLLKWWAEQNTKARHLFAGMYSSKVADGSTSPWPASQITRQIAATRQQDGASGHIHYSITPLATNVGGLADALKVPYAQVALVPATPWLDDLAPTAPTVTARRIASSRSQLVTWEATGAEKPGQWAVYTQRDGAWQLEILPADRKFALIDGAVEAMAIAAVDRSGNESPRTPVTLHQDSRLSQWKKRLRTSQA